MKIAITWDYELYFGETSGTVEQCLLFPTNELLKIGETHGANFTFFVDIGMFTQAEKLDVMQDELTKVENQIRTWQNRHETALHIHPHWEDAIWKNNKWEFNINRYKVADFEPDEAHSIILEYGERLQQLTDKPIVSYRAGGWCIQPFSRFKAAFKTLGIQRESSVFHGGRNDNSPYQYDFSKAPNSQEWTFEDDPCQPENDGTFTEFPIAAQRYSPLFFWRLFVLGRLFPDRHKPLGNGKPAKGGGSRKDFLTKYNHLCVSADGYFVTQIERAIKAAERRGWDKLVIIGHPKACTHFSLGYLEKVLARNSKKHQFVCLRDL